MGKWNDTKTLLHNNFLLFTNCVKSRRNWEILGREIEACAHIYKVTFASAATSPISLGLCQQMFYFDWKWLFSLWWVGCLMTSSRMCCSSRTTASPSTALWSHNTPEVTSASSSLTSIKTTATPNQLSITAYFMFTAADQAHQGNYSCVYHSFVFNQNFSSESKSLSLIVIGRIMGFCTISA